MHNAPSNMATCLRTHRLTHSYTIKPPMAGVWQVSHTSIKCFSYDDHHNVVNRLSAPFYTASICYLNYWTWRFRPAAAAVSHWRLHQQAVLRDEPLQRLQSPVGREGAGQRPPEAPRPQPRPHPLLPAGPQVQAARRPHAAPGQWTLAYRGANVWDKGSFTCYVTLFFWIFDTHPPARNANNVDPYIFVTLFSRKSDTLPPPSALCNTWMDPMNVNI